jgi:serine/threonine protein kinase
VTTPLPQSPSIPGYEPVRVLGTNHAIVYLARRCASGELVALKVYHRDTPITVGWSRDTLLKGLNHPNVLRVFEVGEAEGRRYSVFEYVEEDLAVRLREGPLRPSEAARIAQATALALRCARDRGMVQVDLKPSSVALGTDGVPKLLDFTSVEAIQEADGDERWPLGRPAITPAWSAPEELAGHVSSEAVDVYRVGAILYSMLTAQAPFSGSASETVAAVFERLPAPPRQLNPATWSDLDAVCLRCLEKEPRHRYRSLEALAEDLGRAIRSHASPSG